MQAPTPLDCILAELGIVAEGKSDDGRVFYNTRDIFDRHNFARDAKRCLRDTDWILSTKNTYLLTKEGIVTFAFKKDTSKVRVCMHSPLPHHLVLT